MWVFFVLIFDIDIWNMEVDSVEFFGMEMGEVSGRLVIIGDVLIFVW